MISMNPVTVLLMSILPVKVSPLDVMEDIMTDLLESMINAIKSIITAFTDMIAAVPRAIATIFEQWAWIVGNTWYGPVLGALTIAAVFLIGYGVLWLIERFLF